LKNRRAQNEPRKRGANENKNYCNDIFDHDFTLLLLLFVICHFDF
jgi:hypothetical protein